MGCKQSKDEKKDGEQNEQNEGQAEQTAQKETSADGASPKLIVVFGATGAQGGSVARSLLEDTDAFKVRAVTRNPDSDTAKQLAEKGAEVVKGDLDDADSVKSALEGAYGVFLNTNFFEAGAEKEVAQGKRVVDIAKEQGIQHFIYSGLENVKEAIGKTCKHFDTKAEVEAYIEEQEVPYTSTRMAFYCENMLGIMKPTKNDDGEFVLGYPMGDVAMDMLVVEECGACVRSIFKAGDEYKGKKIGLSADKLKIDEYAAIINKAMGDDKKFVATTMTTEQFGALGFPHADDLADMFEFYQTGNPDRDVELTRKLNPDMPTFEQWVEKNKDAIKALE